MAAGIEHFVPLRDVKECDMAFLLLRALVQSPTS